MGRTERVSDADVLAAIQRTYAPVSTASQLAEELEYTTDGMRKRLERMEDDGLINSRKVGARARVFWLSDDGDKLLAEQ